MLDHKALCTRDRSLDFFFFIKKPWKRWKEGTIMIALSFSKKNHPCCHVEKNLPCREEPTEKNSGRQGWLELKAGEMKSVRGGYTQGVEQKWFADTLQTWSLWRMTLWFSSSACVQIVAPLIKLESCRCQNLYQINFCIFSPQNSGSHIGV